MTNIYSLRGECILFREHGTISPAAVHVTLLRCNQKLLDGNDAAVIALRKTRSRYGALWPHGNRTCAFAEYELMGQMRAWAKTHRHAQWAGTGTIQTSSTGQLKTVLAAVSAEHDDGGRREAARLRARLAGQNVGSLAHRWVRLPGYITLEPDCAMRRVAYRVRWPNGLSSEIKVSPEL